MTVPVEEATANYVPAAAVIRRWRALSGFTGCKVNLYIEFQSLDDVGRILTQVKQFDVHIYEVDISRGGEDLHRKPSAVLSMRLKKKFPHAQIMTAMMDLDCITTIEEV